MTGACADMPSRTCSSSKAAAEQEEPCGNGDAIDDIQDKGQAAAAKAARAACKHGEQEGSDDDWDEEMLADGKLGEGDVTVETEGADKLSDIIGALEQIMDCISHYTVEPFLVVVGTGRASPVDVFFSLGFVVFKLSLP